MWIGSQVDTLARFMIPYHPVQSLLFFIAIVFNIVFKCDKVTPLQDLLVHMQEHGTWIIFTITFIKLSQA